jgi:hypothetical protein
MTETQIHNREYLMYEHHTEALLENAQTGFKNQEPVVQDETEQETDKEAA